jgi:hypothetical protein
MKAEEKKAITEVLEKTLNISTGEVDQLFEENGTEYELKKDFQKKLLDHNVDRVKKFKDAEEIAFKNGQKKATKEFGDNRDKEIKEKFGIDSEKIGVELVEEIVTTKSKAGELDAEKIKIHPEYLKAEKEFSKKLKETEEALTKKYEDREKEIAGEKTFGNVTSQATDILKGLKPVFGTADEAKIKNQIERGLMSDLKQYDFVVNGKEIVVMKKDGKRLEDEHGKAVTFDALIKETSARHWDFEDGTEREGSGASNDAAKKAAAAKAASGAIKYKGQLPKNEDEYFETFANEKDPAQRVALYDEYEASKAAGK